ncbi:hypothetical protein BM536_007065 [Streptomyces phaeoluteigriseus]|uniref:Uncharacterized protein n=1 Tax=Streptomyces phaeoluteigriseus TaxID=114686 RepID=A0A1V6MWC5_9ACTN|nr:hypothetical protein BM536_007065 [Streptomyces phaeoluteigriseus]
MGEIEDAVDRADREAFTQKPPKTMKGRIGYLIRQLGSFKAVAREIGVTADSVNRYPPGRRRQDRIRDAGPLAAPGAQASPPAGRHRHRHHGGDAGPLQLHGT